MSKKINIALATDLGYIKQTRIVIESVMMHASNKNRYIFYILTDEESEKAFTTYRNELCQRFFNCVIKCVIMNEVFENVYLRFSYITKTTYYRLYLPNIISEEKCIYLDSDIIVCDDIAQMYDISMEDYEIAGVKNIPTHISSDKQTEHMKEIGISSARQYINAGVLLLNLSRMRERCFCQAVNAIINKNFPLQDQDIINIIAYGKIKLLPFKYNVQGIWMDMIDRYPEIGISSNEKEEAIRKPIIIHYASAEKPWEFFEIPFADIWWNVCKQTTLFADFYKENINSFYYYGIIYNNRIWHLEKFSKEWMTELKKYDDIYIYGAGVKGRKVTNILKEQNVMIRSILVSSLEDNSKSLEGVKVEQITDSLNKDAIFIIALSRRFLPQVRRLLFEKGYYKVISVEDI